jgi:hypothetical protein
MSYNSARIASVTARCSSRNGWNASARDWSVVYPFTQGSSEQISCPSDRARRST